MKKSVTQIPYSDFWQLVDPVLYPHPNQPHFCLLVSRISRRFLTGWESYQLVQQVRTVGAAEECAPCPSVAGPAGEEAAQPGPPPLIQAVPHHGDQPQGEMSCSVTAVLLGLRIWLSLWLQDSGCVVWRFSGRNWLFSTNSIEMELLVQTIWGL